MTKIVSAPKPSDLVNAGAGAVSANAASDPVQKTALATAVVSGVTGAARDSRSAAMAKGANSAFSPPSLNFGKTRQRGHFRVICIFTHSIILCSRCFFVGYFLQYTFQDTTFYFEFTISSIFYR